MDRSLTVTGVRSRHVVRPVLRLFEILKRAIAAIQHTPSLRHATVTGARCMMSVNDPIKRSGRSKSQMVMRKSKMFWP